LPHGAGLSRQSNRPGFYRACYLAVSLYRSLWDEELSAPKTTVVVTVIRKSAIIDRTSLRLRERTIPPPE
jgi:hypothetical protein